jgi:hypothetical protein
MSPYIVWPVPIRAATRFARIALRHYRAAVHIRLTLSADKVRKFSIIFLDKIRKLGVNRKKW